MSEQKHTPGPWRWELNKKSKKLNLCGHGECGPYDFTVMDFERWGMNGAIPRFREGEMNTMIKADEFGKVVPLRAHHSDWFQSLSHPDAQLIAAAPDLLEALKCFVNDFDLGYSLMTDNMINKAKLAINKAEGK